MNDTVRRYALAIIAHEIPQEVGDYIVLLNAGLSRSRALVYNALGVPIAAGVLYPLSSHLLLNPMIAAAANTCHRTARPAFAQAL